MLRKEKSIIRRERTYNGELENTTPKYRNASIQNRAIKNTITHKSRVKLQKIIIPEI